MTSDRILNLMALMRDIERPSGIYSRAVRRAAGTFTGSAENERAQARGNDALLVIEQAVRTWVAEHPNPDAVSDLERARSIAVALKQENAKLIAELAEEKASNDPRLRCLLIKAAPDQNLYVGWSGSCEMPAGVWSRESAIAYGFPPSRLDRADENGSNATNGYTSGHWDDDGFVAEQRGWLKRERLAKYAVLWLDGHHDAAFDLLEPFEGESEVRR